jgi:hypothetical protein
MESETAATLAAVEQTKRHLREQLEKCDVAILGIRAKKKMTVEQKEKQVTILVKDRDYIVNSLRELGVNDEEEEEEDDEGGIPD